jgi:hypothetical protein
MSVYMVSFHANQPLCRINNYPHFKRTKTECQRSFFNKLFILFLCSFTINIGFTDTVKWWRRGDFPPVRRLNCRPVDIAPPCVTMRLALQSVV